MREGQQLRAPGVTFITGNLTSRDDGISEPCDRVCVCEEQHCPDYAPSPPVSLYLYVC